MKDGFMPIRIRRHDKNSNCTQQPIFQGLCAQMIFFRKNLIRHS